MVDPATQLNANFQDIDTKLDGFNHHPSTITGPPQGIEAFYNVAGADQSRIAVYDGATWRLPLNHQTAWTGWQTLTLRSPVVARTGYPPKANVNPVTRRVKLAGAVQADAALSAWPTGSDVEITDDVAISTTFAPVPGGTSYSQVATAQVTGTDQVATANVRIQSVTTPNRVGIFVRFQGDAGGGNFVVLDGIEWWY